MLENLVKICDLHSPIDLRQITVRNQLRWLIANTNLEACRTPIDKLNSPLGLDAGNSGMNLLRHNITTVEQTSSHVLSVTRIALDHLIVRFKARVGNLLNRVGFMRGSGCRDDRSIRDQREVDTRIRNKIGLELVQIDIEGAVETERSSDTRDNYKS